jgi:hypothetical protein
MPVGLEKNRIYAQLPTVEATIIRRRAAPVGRLRVHVSVMYTLGPGRPYVVEP